MMKTIEELKAMTVEEIQFEMMVARKEFDGDYQTIVEDIMVEKEMEMINSKNEIKNMKRKELETLVLDLAKNLKKSKHQDWVVGSYRVLGQLSQATVSKSWLKVWKKEHLIEIAKGLQ